MRYNDPYQHHGRVCVLLTIYVQLPKLDVAGSIPVSRFIYKEVMLMKHQDMQAALEAYE
jgi:hypothetical protein